MAEQNETRHQELRRSWLRGYRPHDVELLVSRSTLNADQLENELVATRSRVQAMQTELEQAHRRLDDLRVERERRDQLELEARARASQIVTEAEHAAAAMRTDSLREVADLQRQLEDLFQLRAGMTQALSSVLEDIGETIKRVASSPAAGLESAPRIELGSLAESLAEFATEPESEPEPEHSFEPAPTIELDSLESDFAEFTAEQELGF